MQEQAWRDFLQYDVERHPEAEAMTGKRKYADIIDIQAMHCKFCYTPISRGTECLARGADQQVDIAVV